MDDKIYRSKKYLLKEIKTKTYPEIAKNNGVNISTIFRNLKRFGLTKPTSKKWMKKELNLLKKRYSTDRKFMKEIKGRTKSSIYHKAFHLKLQRYVKPLNYNIDEKFFNKWSKEFAYFLGFFIADGHIDKKKATIVIKIQNRDGYILNKFLKLLKTNRPLKYERGYPCLKIHNNLIKRKLIEIGCKPGDSLNNSYPIGMNDKYFFHFLRGYIDGDGSIYICKSKKSRQKNVLRVAILGSKSFIAILKRKIGCFLNKKIKYKISKYTHTKNLYCIVFNGHLARMLCNRLYQNCGDLYLKRKKEKFNIHLKQLIKDGKTSYFN